ncbi:hypothetical protein HH682_14590 [Rosenbergiella sp. S61]|uniref:Uncharacterized protein n=1 Tax=Rosenbergiella gaditana TaxID=2726987 RepID=A0ABS5SZT1_9GAMM|nr:hypothetical protein [Rosenbergiella gaditana]MBT0725614.1 hypothetical protein [Rosenbergiella gaditana]
MIHRGIVLATCILSASCMASESNWNTYINRVVSADPVTMQALPAKIKSIGDSLDDKHAEQLTTAISMALIKEPVAVLDVTNQFKTSPDRLQQRFGTLMICSIPLMTNATMTQVEEYFAKAEPVLEKAGTPAAECLSNMRDTIDEVRQETAQNQAK